MTTDNLDGWWIIDAVDGRRWLGKVIERQGEEYVIPHVAVLEPAFEYVEPTTAAVTVPRMTQAPAILAREQAAPQMTMELNWVATDAAQFRTPFGMPMLTRWTVRVAGGTPITALPGQARDGLLKLVQSLEGHIAKAQKDMARANGQRVTSVDEKS